MLPSHQLNNKHCISFAQEEDIIRIADTAVHTTENIKDANEEIREVKLDLYSPLLV